MPLCWLFIVSLISACTSEHAHTGANAPDPEPAAIVAIADEFAYPIGASRSITQGKDEADEWFNALDFGEDDHLGEDWNKNSGGNTDCGEPVYAAAKGVITYAEDAGPGWGNVVIISHTLPNRMKVQTLYGHLQVIKRSSGTVAKRELIGTIGSANGKYLCHLHFELRESSSPSWDRVGVGYSTERDGWLDPSDFIDQRLGER
jgi:murein DD-endopeptidase MepM/ murein hydrolase activator NlpD